MKKKIKDLTREERIVLCHKHKKCDKCRFNYGIGCLLQPVTLLVFNEIKEILEKEIDV